VLADGEIDPVYEEIAKLKGDPISPRYLTAYTSLPKFTMVRRNKDIFDLYGSMMDDADFPKEVQAALRHQPVHAG
jgi:hypothetical protein